MDSGWEPKLSAIEEVHQEQDLGVGPRARKGNG